MSLEGLFSQQFFISDRIITYASMSISGDIFECEEDLQDASIWMQNSHNVEDQETSRQTILDIADYIIPGHGPMFKVKV